MSMPGFSAEASISQSVKAHYRSRVRQEDAGIVPAANPRCRACINRCMQLQAYEDELTCTNDCFQHECFNF